MRRQQAKLQFAVHSHSVQASEHLHAHITRTRNASSLRGGGACDKLGQLRSQQAAEKLSAVSSRSPSPLVLSGSVRSLYWSLSTCTCRRGSFVALTPGSRWATGCVRRQQAASWQSQMLVYSTHYSRWRDGRSRSEASGRRGGQ